MDNIVNIILSDKVFTILITLLISSIIIIVISRAQNKIEVSNAASIKTKKKNTIVALIFNIVKYIVLIVAGVIILSKLGVNVSAIVASLGVVGVIGGLALQDALKDIIAGCNIIMDDYFVVGDLVTIGDFTGIVTEFGLKRTKIKAFDGTVLVIANREISQIKNLSAAKTVWYLNIPVAYEVSEKQVAKVMKDIIKDIVNTKLTTKDPEYLGVNDFCDSNVNYLLQVECESKDRYALRREVLKIVKDNFDEKGIKIPYPQVEVHDGK
ncbi:MAG: mechanosensitive ion channel family protein [Bacilli bacterium]|nr:mechanosensitive ion channel family protein [Bacilli bacterium]